MSQLYYRYISLERYRSFRHLTISFEDDVTVLIADNGKGKTSILDAVAASLHLLVKSLSEKSPKMKLSTRDLQRSIDEHIEDDLRYSADAYLFGNLISWSQILYTSGYFARQKHLTEELRQSARSIKKSQYPSQLADDKIVLPVLAYYGTKRFLSRSRPKQTTGRTLSEARLSAYYSCFDSDVSFATFESWYSDLYYEMNQPSYGSKYYLRPESIVHAVNEAVRVILEPVEWESMFWDKEENCVSLKSEILGKLPLSYMSDGIKNIVSLVADLAHRTARLNPQYGGDVARLTPGLVLIDEIDLHLHPKWQQKIISLLTTAFPEVQFIVTTHSPQVLTTVHKSSIRIVDCIRGEGVVTTPDDQTRGVESNDTLSKVMSVDPTPPVEEAGWLSQYRAYLSLLSETSTDAAKLYADIVEHFGRNHPIVEELEVDKKFADFKRRKGLKQSDS